MTIAAGFVARDGILLCSDSLYTSAEKDYDEKIYSSIFAGKKTFVSFALAGNEDYGKMIIEDCCARVHGLPPVQCSLRSIAKVIREEMQRAMPEYREQCNDSTQQPEFLLALSDERGSTGLFVVRNTAVRRVSTYASIGAGGYLANYVIGTSYDAGMSVDEMVIIALRAMSAAKKHDAYCGGWSRFQVIRSGDQSSILPYSPGKAEEYILEFERKAARLLLDAGNLSLPDEEFTSRIGTFAAFLVGLRQSWREGCSSHRELVNSLTPSRPTSSESSQT